MCVFTVIWPNCVWPQTQNFGGYFGGYSRLNSRLLFTRPLGARADAPRRVYARFFCAASRRYVVTERGMNIVVVLAVNVAF